MLRIPEFECEIPKDIDISKTITAEHSPQHIASGRTQAGNPWFSSASANH